MRTAPVKFLFEDDFAAGHAGSGSKRSITAAAHEAALARAEEDAYRNAFAAEGLKNLQATARERRNVFEALMEAVKTHSLGQISHALYDVGGEYRRNM